MQDAVWEQKPLNKFLLDCAEMSSGSRTKQTTRRRLPCVRRSLCDDECMWRLSTRILKQRISSASHSLMSRRSGRTAAFMSDSQHTAASSSSPMPLIPPLVQQVDTLLTDIYPKLESAQEEFAESIVKQAAEVNPSIAIKYETDDAMMNSAVKPDTDASDDANGPANWRKAYNAIIYMRRLRDAPVDTVGCERLGNKQSDARQFRLRTLVALMLSSQTKDPVTAAALNKLNDHFTDGLTVANILVTDTTTINSLINKVGFHNRKADYIKRTAIILREKYHDDIPNTIEGLCELPGVGEKMAYLTMQVAWNQSVGIGVDTHVHRICNRLGWIHTNHPDKTRVALESWLPRVEWGPINALMVGFGQQICLPINPKCMECAANIWCEEGQKNVRRMKKGLSARRQTKADARDGFKKKKLKKTVSHKVKEEKPLSVAVKTESGLIKQEESDAVDEHDDDSEDDHEQVGGNEPNADNDDIENIGIATQTSPSVERDEDDHLSLYERVKRRRHSNKSKLH